MTQSDPWKAEALGAGRFRFTNVSGGKLAMVVVMPFEGGEVEVEDGGVPNDPYAVRAPVEAGKSFTAKVRGSVRITATIPTTMENVFWKFDTP